MYRYALHTDAGANEHLGFIDIRDDNEAKVFGQEVVDGLMLEFQPTLEQQPTLEITDGHRHVGSVPLATIVRQKAYG